MTAGAAGGGRLPWQQRGRCSTRLGQDEAQCLANCRHPAPSQIPVLWLGARWSHVSAMKILICFCHVPSTSSCPPSTNLVLQPPGAGCFLPTGSLDSSPFLSEKPRAGVFHHLGFAPPQKLPSHSRNRK